MSSTDTSLPDDPATLCEAFQNTVAHLGDHVALRTPGDTVSLTWEEYGERVRRLAAGLAAQGVGPGDTVALMMVNRPEAALVDMAALHLRAVPFSVYNSSSAEQLDHLLTDAGAKVVVTQQAFLGPIAASGVTVKTLVSVDGGDQAMTVEELEAAGDPSYDLVGAAGAVRPDDVLTLIYTSGTTGPPKGVELTHRSMLAQLRSIDRTMPVRAGARVVSYLPTAHIADRWYAYYSAVLHGVGVTYVADPTTLFSVLPDARPTYWGGVPRIWEKLKAGLEAKGITDPAALPEETRRAVLTQLGLDEVEWSISGAAPAAPAVLRFFTDLGLPICEIWAMSETSCCGTVNPPDAIRIGTVGRAMDGAELRLADDGELLIRGEFLMRGYRNQPEKTAEAIDADGWLHTGDVATIDEDGYVTIVDRKKELIINAAGKNMSPANIEQALKGAHPLIGQAAIVGDRRPYNVALLVLDPDVGAAYAASNGLPDGSVATLAADPGVLAEVALAVEQANARLSRVEQVKRFRVLPTDWLPGGDELTPTMKLKRRPIAEKYADVIEELYAGA